MMEAVIKKRLSLLPLQSLLEVSAIASADIQGYSHDHNVRYHHCTPNQYDRLSERFDLALVHDIEGFPLTQMRPCVGLLKNLLSERIWLLVARDYCPAEEWISLGFKHDTIPGQSGDQLDSYSYNLETYNHKRDWNNSRFWANPEHWDKRF